MGLNYIHYIKIKSLATAQGIIDTLHRHTSAPADQEAWSDPKNITIAGKISLKARLIRFIFSLKIAINRMYSNVYIMIVILIIKSARNHVKIPEDFG